MADIPYLDPGVTRKIAISDWNAIYAEADRKLNKMYRGICPAWAINNELYASGFIPSVNYCSPLKFFFWDGEIHGTPSNPGQQIIKLYYDKANVAAGSPGGGAGFFRNYTHAPFTAFANSCDVADPETDVPGFPGTPAQFPRPIYNYGMPCVRVKPPNLATARTMFGEIWPLFDITNAGGDDLVRAYAGSCLGVSLEAHTRALSAFYISVDLGGYGLSGGIFPNPCEHVSKWTTIDVIIADGFGSTLNWGGRWNKYGFVRFNNVQPFACAVVIPGSFGFPPTTFTIPAMGSRCMRQVRGGGWRVSPWNYFWEFQAGDATILGDETPNARGVYDSVDAGAIGAPYANCQKSNNVTAPFVAALLLTNPEGTDGSSPNNNNGSLLGEIKCDATKFWDCEGVFCGPGKSYANVADGTKLGDLLFHRGSLAVVNPSAPNPPLVRVHTGIDSVDACLAGTGIVAAKYTPGSYNPDGLQGWKFTAAAARDLVTLSSDLVFRTAFDFAVTIEPGNDFNIPLLYNIITGVASLTDVVIPSGQSYTDESGNIVTVGADTHVWQVNADFGGAPSPNPWSVFSTLGDFLDYVRTLPSWTDNFPVTDASVYFSIFGPILCITQERANDMPVNTQGQTNPASNPQFGSGWLSGLEIVDGGATIRRRFQVPLGVSTWFQWSNRFDQAMYGKTWVPYDFHKPSADEIFQMPYSWPMYGSRVNRQANLLVVDDVGLFTLTPFTTRAWVEAKYNIGDIQSQPFALPSTNPVVPSYWDGNGHSTVNEVRLGVKQFFEEGQFADWVNASGNSVAPDPLKLLDTLHFLCPFVGTQDMYAWIYAWMIGKPLEYQGFGVSSPPDYLPVVERKSISPDYNADIRPNLIDHCPFTSNNGPGYNALPITLTHYNLVASVVNSVVACKMLDGSIVDLT